MVYCLIGYHCNLYAWVCELYFFISYRYEVQILEVAGALTHDSFMTISFPQGEGPHDSPQLPY